MAHSSTSLPREQLKRITIKKLKAIVVYDTKLQSHAHSLFFFLLLLFLLQLEIHDWHNKEQTKSNSRRPGGESSWEGWPDSIVQSHEDLQRRSRGGSTTVPEVQNQASHVAAAGGGWRLSVYAAFVRSFQRLSEF